LSTTCLCHRDRTRNQNENQPQHYATRTRPTGVSFTQRELTVVERCPPGHIPTECSEATLIGPDTFRHIDWFLAIHLSPPDDFGLQDQVLLTLGDENPAIILAPLRLTM
jgi:hypothetical protein